MAQSSDLQSGQRVNPGGKVPKGSQNGEARMIGKATYYWNGSRGQWERSDIWQSEAPPAAAPAPNTQKSQADIFADASLYANKTVPTGDVWANALMDSINNMGEGTLEQFNARGQGVNSGIFTDALAKNATSMTTQSQLDQSKLLSETMKDYFTGDKAQYYDQWKTRGQWDLDRELANQRNTAFANALKSQKSTKKRTSIGSLLGTAAGALAGLPGGVEGVKAGAQIGGGMGENAGYWTSD